MEASTLVSKLQGQRSQRLAVGATNTNTRLAEAEREKESANFAPAVSPK